MEILLDQVTTHRNHIKYEPLTFSLSELVNMYKATPKEIDINPAFQRLFRWTREQQSSFIESLILEMPIPPLFFFENEKDGSWDLIDGLQRLSTIIKFIGSVEDVPPELQGEENNENEYHYKMQNNLQFPLQLLPGEYLTKLSGLTFKRLPGQLQLNLKRSRIHIYVLKRETKLIYKYEVFKRLNRGGSWLNDQELRNCSVRLLGNEFPEFLKRISKSDDFISATGIEELDIQKGKAEELALRYFAMKNYTNNFRHDVSAFLTKYMEAVTSKSVNFDYGIEEDLFNKTFRIINDCLPNCDAFRFKGELDTSIGQFSPTLFEIISIGIALNVEVVKDIDKIILKDKIVSLINEAKSKGLTGSGSNSKVKTINRIETGKEWFKNATC